jgi:hypothetical protein
LLSVPIEASTSERGESFRTRRVSVGIDTSTKDGSNRSRAIGAGIGIGVGLGGGREIGVTMFMDGDVATRLTMGAGAGLIIALVSGSAVYYTATSD